MAIGHALEDVLEVGEGLDAVELGGGDERCRGGPASWAAVAACEEMVLAAEGDGTDVRDSLVSTRRAVGS